jgi:hypothetical protein
MPPRVDPPLALLAELTHRCPLSCPYCSNPVELERAASELGEAEWRRVLAEAASLGVLQVHFSGGEPMARRDLLALIATASEHGLYSNLITSGTLGGEREIAAFAAAGLKHVQLSFQDFAPANNDRIAGLAGAHARKTRFASAVRAADLPLTVNMVVHRQNLGGVPEMIDMALALGARQAEGHPGDRLCRAGLSRGAAEILHEWLGASVPEYYPLGEGRALPCRREPARPRLSVDPRRHTRRHLVSLGRLQSLSRHRLDGRAVPQLRPPRDRLGRLPLSGLFAGRRCEPSRSGVRPVVRPRCGRGRAAAGGERAAGIGLSSFQLRMA